MTPYTYTFQSSQPLTEEQLEFLNSHLGDLPFQDYENYSDVPEFITDVLLTDICFEEKTEQFKCPIDYAGCTQNCGNYGCGN